MDRQENAPPRPAQNLGARHEPGMDDLLTKELADRLLVSLERVYDPARPLPLQVPKPAAIPDEGLGMEGLADLWETLIAGATKLAMPGMMAHMDTITHPAAALTDAVVSALDNNPLFRELAPFASTVEEQMIAAYAARLGLPATTRGLFASGGSLANLTALFAACGGYGALGGRDKVRIFATEAIHTSIERAAAVLGLAQDQLVFLPSDFQGRMEVEALEKELGAHGGSGTQNIVVAVLGNTMFGAVDALEDIARVAEDAGAWLHVDAVYGGGLAFTERYGGFLAGLARANSVSIAPQKWHYVPRLCAMVLFPDAEGFDRRLQSTMPYSAGTVFEHPNRGAWGLQGSRRSDALTLWVTLQVVGARRMAGYVDQTIDAAKVLNRTLTQSDRFRPVHDPDLSIQVFELAGDGSPQAKDKQHTDLHQRLAQAGGPVISLSNWQGRLYLRVVVLNPETGEAEFAQMVQALST